MVDAGFYDDIYTANPGKWTNIGRDYMVLQVIAGLLPEPKRVLDVGCGNGHTLALFKIQWMNIETWGVDISDKALELTKKRLPDANIYKQLPTLKEYFDVILCLGTAEHFQQPEVELYHIHQLLKPGGFLYLETPNCLSYDQDKNEGFRKNSQGIGQVEWHLKRESWEKIIKDAGLRVHLSLKGSSPLFEFTWVLT